MKSVFLVQHLHTLEEDREDIKIIGIYRTKETALRAIEQVKAQPGFADHPDLRDPLIDEEIEDGFYIDEYQLDENHWTDGYATITN